jgi:hypothetical protein
MRNKEKSEMSTKTLFSSRNSVLATTLATLGWLILVLCWMAFAWGQYSLLQNLASLAISTLLFAAIVGAMWSGDLGFVPAATILATLGWLSFALYWIGFAWSRHTLLQNSAILALAYLACGGIVVVLWLRARADECC